LKTKGVQKMRHNFLDCTGTALIVAGESTSVNVISMILAK